MFASLVVLALAADIAASSPPPAPLPPAGVQALIAAGFDPRTKLDGEAVQVIVGQRAVFRLDDAGKPVMEAVESGRIDMVLPDGKPDTYLTPTAGRLGFALDASPEKRQSVMKVWNGLSRPVAYEVELTALRHGKLMKRKAPICAVAAGQSTYEVWPDPILSVTLSKFAETPASKSACQ
jgi:hypothetical protein